MLTILLWILMWFKIYGVQAVTFPENPCPEVFSYRRNGDHIYGQAIVPYDGSNKLTFSVNASFKALFQGRNLKINLLNPPRSTSSREKLRYNIQFPFNNLIPKITQVTYNGRIFCSGPPEPLTPGGGVTNLWASHFYQFYGELMLLPNEFNQVLPQFPRSPPQFSTQNSNPQLPPTSTPIEKSRSSGENLSDIVVSIFSTPRSTTSIITNPKSAISSTCGVSGLAIPLVLGGMDVSRGQFPWLGALFAYNVSANSYDYRCTVNLISEKHVITAARCIQYYRVQLVATDDILVVLGNNDLSHWATSGAVSRSASEVAVHPDFKNNYNSANADIAVITLDEPVEFSKTIRPICLWENSDALNPYFDKKGLVAGWGKDEKTEKLFVFKAKYVYIPIVRQEECLRTSAEVANLTSDNTFCAGDLEGNGPCIGDGGAGFLTSRNGVFHLRGISSRVITKNGVCSLHDNYAIFCDVAKYMPWIKQTMNQ